MDLHGAAAEEVAHPEGLALLPREPGALGSRLEGGAGGGVSKGASPPPPPKKMQL